VPDRENPEISSLCTIQIKKLKKEIKNTAAKTMIEETKTE